MFHLPRRSRRPESRPGAGGRAPGRRLAGLALVGLAGLTACQAASDGGDGAAGEPLSQAACRRAGEALGTSTSLDDQGVCRGTFPRSDLSVRLMGATLPPGMGLTSWAALRGAGGDSAIVMGDLALTADELAGVMSGLRENGVRVTAVHRHMLGESPTMSFMHYLGLGPVDSLAGAVRAALERGGALPDAPGPPGAARTGEAGVVAGAACDALARTLGADPAEAATGPGYCKVSLPRTDLDVTVDGVSVPASMGIGSWFAFRETLAGDAAVVTGDMALTQEQVNPAVGALREAGIGVVALHNHMLHDEPRVMFFHFQARGAPKELARGLRSGLEAAGLPERR